MSRRAPKKPEFREEKGVVLKAMDGMPVVHPDEVRELIRGVVAPKKIAFLIALAQLGNRGRAAEACGISKVLVWQWQRDDPAFKKAFVRAMEAASDLLEDEMIRRAAEGVLEPVYQGGKLVGSMRRYSDTLLMFALRGAKPKKYAERQRHEHDLAPNLLERLTRGRERALGRAPAEVNDDDD